MCLLVSGLAMMTKEQVCYFRLLSLVWIALWPYNSDAYMLRLRQKTWRGLSLNQTTSSSCICFDLGFGIFFSIFSPFEISIGVSQTDQMESSCLMNNWKLGILNRKKTVFENSSKLCGVPLVSILEHKTKTMCFLLRSQHCLNMKSKP